MSNWEPFLNALGKYSWRSMAGVCAASGIVLFFAGNLGISDWMQPMRPWVIIAFIVSGVILLTYIGTSSLARLGKRRPKGKIYFHPDKFNTGWSKQHETEMNVRIGGTFTYSGPGDLIILTAFLKGTSFAPFFAANIPRSDGSGNLISVSQLLLREGFPQTAFSDLKFTPVLGTPGKKLRREMFLRDNLNRNYSIGTIDLPYLGR